MGGEGAWAVAARCTFESSTILALSNQHNTVNIAFFSMWSFVLLTLPQQLRTRNKDLHKKQPRISSSGTNTDSTEAAQDGCVNLQRNMWKIDWNIAFATETIGWKTWVFQRVKTYWSTYKKLGNHPFPAMKKIKQETPSHKAAFVADKSVVNGKISFDYDIPKKSLPAVNTLVNTHWQ